MHLSAASDEEDSSTHRPIQQSFFAECRKTVSFENSFIIIIIYYYFDYTLINLDGLILLTSNEEHLLEVERKREKGLR